MAPLSLGARAAQLAGEDPDRVALTFFPASGPPVDVTAGEIDRWSNRIGRLLRRAGVSAGDRVGVGLRNSPEHVVAAIGAWKIGAGIVTMRWDVPDWERDRLVEATRPVAIVGDRAGATSAGVPIVDVADAAGQPDDAFELVTPAQAMAIPTGGSTGASKAVVLPVPPELEPGQAFGPSEALYGIPKVERHIVMGPLYHANPLLMVHAGLFEEQHVLLMEKFDPARFLDIVDRRRPDFVTLVPTMMKRLLDEPRVAEIDWSCFSMVLHGTAPCPAWLKRRWIDLVGAERLWEVFASSELVGSIVVRGDEWLEHPGTVGRPTPGTLLKILDDDGNEVAPGEIGEIYMKLAGVDTPLFDYLGGERPKVSADGFVSVGDLGSVDADGYVYSADRRKDLIITGGANVVPAEVEAALGEHGDVADVVVVGLPDDDWGQRVHAIVQPRPGAAVSAESLVEFARQRLAAYKVPKSVELVDALDRSEMGKIRRSAFASERAGGR